MGPTPTPSSSPISGSHPANPLAPGWWVTCPKCAKCRPYPGIRLGAVSVGKKMLAYCTDCRRLVWAKVEKKPDTTAFTAADDADRTWADLLAFVSEGTIDIDTAEQIFAAPAPENHKREVAAQLAEGHLDAPAAIRLLNLKPGAKP